MIEEYARISHSDEAIDVTLTTAGEDKVQVEVDAKRGVIYVHVAGITVFRLCQAKRAQILYNGFDVGQAVAVAELMADSEASPAPPLVEMPVEPVEKDNKWYYFDEKAVRQGPYDSYLEACARIKSHAVYLNTGKKLWPYQVRCRHHGMVELTRHQYLAQMRRANAKWECPECGEEATWSDEAYEAAVDAGVI